MLPNNFIVDFFEVRNGVESRHRLQGNVIQLNGARSDFAVQAYLKRCYPQSEIAINQIDWK